MVAATDVSKDFRLGRIIAQTLGSLRRNLVLFVSLAFVAELPKLALALALMRTPMPATLLAVSGMRAWLVNQPLTLGPSLFDTAFSYLLAAALAQGTVADLSGKRLSLGACLHAAFRDPFSLIAIGIISYFVVLLGSLLLLVPGMIIAMALAVVVPVNVVEHTTIGNTFRRSANLTFNYKGQLFGLFLILVAIVFPLSFAALRISGFGILQASLARHSATYLIAFSMVEIFSSLLLGIGSAVVYYHLRAIKEGIEPDQLAAVFD